MATEDQKQRARTRVRLAIDNGQLVPQPCEVCGAQKVDAHHDDYRKPLSVRWLCRRHHRQLHSPAPTPTIVIRADLTTDEYAEIRKVAIDRRQRVSKVVGDHMRKLIPDASKGKGK